MQGQGAVQRCSWGGQAGATCCAYLETRGAHLALEVGWGWGAAGGGVENREDGVPWGLRSFLASTRNVTGVNSGRDARLARRGWEGHLPSG